MKNKSKSSREVSYDPGSVCSHSPSNFCSSSQSYRPAGSPLQGLGPSQTNLATKLRHSSHELWPRQREEETNVDTGNKVILSECSDSPLNRFSQDIQKALLQSQASCCLLTGSGSTISLHSEGRNNLLSSHIAKRNKGSGQVPSSFPLGAPETSRGNGKDEEEEFFIWLFKYKSCSRFYFKCLISEITLKNYLYAAQRLCPCVDTPAAYTTFYVSVKKERLNVVCKRANKVMD